MFSAAPQGRRAKELTGSDRPQFFAHGCFGHVRARSRTPTPEKGYQFPLGVRCIGLSSRALPQARGVPYQDEAREIQLGRKDTAMDAALVILGYAVLFLATFAHCSGSSH